MVIPAFCSIETVAVQLDCSNTTVREYVKRGILPQPQRIGGLVRWRWEEVESVFSNKSQTQNDPILAAINGT